MVTSKRQEEFITIQNKSNKWSASRVKADNRQDLLSGAGADTVEARHTTRLTMMGTVS